MLRSVKCGEIIRVTEPESAKGLYVVISQCLYNAYAEAVVCCEIADITTNYPYEVPIDSQSLYILSDHITRIKAPTFEVLGAVGPSALQATRRMIAALTTSCTTDSNSCRNV